MMVTFHLLALAALLPCLLCQAVIDVAGDPLCKDKVCPSGQRCRHFKPCGQQETCDIIAACTTTEAFRGGCKFGDPVLYSNNGTEEDLTCFSKAPCPSNGYCSTVLQDISAVCCLSDPAKTAKNDLLCPSFEPGTQRSWCVDECKSDGDCDAQTKCCHTGCSKECVKGNPRAPPPPSPPTPQVVPQHPALLSLERLSGRGIVLSDPYGDPCAGKMCPAGQSCGHYKPCENCEITGRCTATRRHRGGCKFGNPVMQTRNGKDEYLYCHTNAPCPSNGYCSTALMDVAAVCCLSDPSRSHRDDIGCPVPIADPSRFWCVDECKTDGDCDTYSKCCHTGCSRECIPAGFPLTTQQPLPSLMTAPADPCAGKVCPAGQTCRHYKPCGPTENCGDVTAICTAGNKMDSGGCLHGEPILYNGSRALEMLGCHLKAPCPGNAYCSTVLMDVSSRCCLTDPAKKVNDGICPRNAPRQTDPYFCYDECKHDGDCGWNGKCCNTGCKLECVTPEFVPEIVPTPPSIPLTTPKKSNDPCKYKVCPVGQTCRHYKPCGLTENCGDVIAICTAGNKMDRGGCRHGEPILYNGSRALEMLVCYLEAPCPGNAYCSTVLMDTSSRCCLADPAKQVKSGFCPRNDPFQSYSGYCYDQCKHDGDCSWDEKCCNTGCKLECRMLDIKNTRDPCDNKKCPANMYCRRRNQRCRSWPKYCGAEGQCLPCPNQHLVGRRNVITDPDGCPAIIRNGGGMNTRPVNRRPIMNPILFYWLNEYINKK